jgi:hypothetical protein
VTQLEGDFSEKYNLLESERIAADDVIGEHGGGDCLQSRRGVARFITASSCRQSA